MNEFANSHSTFFSDLKIQLEILNIVLGVTEHYLKKKIQQETYLLSLPPHFNKYNFRKKSLLPGPWDSNLGQDNEVDSITPNLGFLMDLTLGRILFYTAFSKFDYCPHFFFLDALKVVWCIEKPMKRELQKMN